MLSNKRVLANLRVALTVIYKKVTDRAATVDRLMLSASRLIDKATSYHAYYTTVSKPVLVSYNHHRPVKFNRGDCLPVNPLPLNLTWGVDRIAGKYGIDYGFGDSSDPNSWRDRGYIQGECGSYQHMAGLTGKTLRAYLRDVLAYLNQPASKLTGAPYVPQLCKRCTVVTYGGLIK